MELASSHWSFDPTTFDLDLEVGALCGLRLDLYDETNLEALSAGLWWVFPLGRSFASNLIGLRLRPGTPLGQSPVVITSAAEAVTLCARPAVLVPTQIFARMVIGEPRWSAVAGLSTAKWESAVALHRALGGEDDLSELRSVAADRSLATRVGNRDDEHGRLRALAEIYTRLDPAPETAVYWRYAAAVAVARTNATEPPRAGCWNPALAALAFWASRGGSTEAARSVELDAAWEMMQYPPGLDTSRDGTGVTLTPSSYKSVDLLISAAKVVDERRHRAWAADPRLPAVQALAGINPPDGTAYLEAARALAHDGDAAGAFDALTAAAYWSYRADGTALPAALDAAIDVARHSGAADIADALEQQRDAYQHPLAEA